MTYYNILRQGILARLWRPVLVLFALLETSLLDVGRRKRLGHLVGNPDMMYTQKEEEVQERAQFC